MPTIIDIYSYMEVWKKKTYAEGLQQCFQLRNNEQLKNITIKVLENQGLLDKPMEGHSVEKLDVNEGKTDIIFSKIFSRLVDSYITPANYVVNIVDECLKKGITNIDDITGIVGRGLRAFPSFVRELDLAFKVTSLLPEGECVRNPVQDLDEHTDILFKYRKKEYRIWSYQLSDRGIQNTTKRVLEQRGMIPKGIHVMCPIDIRQPDSINEIDGWKLHSDKYVKTVKNMIVEGITDDYSSLKRREQYQVQSYLKKMHMFEK